MSLSKVEQKHSAPDSGLSRLPKVPRLLHHDGSMTDQLERLSHQTARIWSRREWIARGRVPARMALGRVREERLWHRQVTLGGDRPWLWGLTVMLPASRRPKLKLLQKAGDRPLGTLLFDAMHAQRISKTITRIDGQHLALGPSACRPGSGELLWARQSLFAVAGELVYLAEVLLPDCPSI